MELLQLQYFYESAQHESFSKTAKKHMVPLSSVSISIKNLEKELGTTLFDRTSNSVSLNDKGRQFYYSVKSMFEELDSGVMALSARTNDSRQIKIFAKTIRETVIGYVQGFHKLYPDVKFLVDVQQGDEVPDIYKYDIIVDKKESHYDTFETFDLCSFKVRVECPASNPLCQKDSVSLRVLKNQPFVTTSKDSEAFAIFTEACKRNGFLPNVVLECNDYTCRDRCVSSGMGLGITLGTSINFSSSQVQFLNVTDFNQRYTASVYYKPVSYFGNVKAFIDFIKNKIS